MALIAIVCLLVFLILPPGPLEAAGSKRKRPASSSAPLPRAPGQLEPELPSALPVANSVEELLVTFTMPVPEPELKRKSWPAVYGHSKGGFEMKSGRRVPSTDHLPTLDLSPKVRCKPCFILVNFQSSDHAGRPSPSFLGDHNVQG